MALLYAGILLVNHKGRPVKLRLVCTLLLPVLVGMVLHLLLARGPYGFDLEHIKPMWKDGQSLLFHVEVWHQHAQRQQQAHDAADDPGLGVIGGRYPCIWWASSPPLWWGICASDC